MQETLSFGRRRPVHSTAEDPPATWVGSYTGPREDNQDYYGRADHQTPGYDWLGKGCLYVVADGMGGLQGGAEAARLSVNEVIAHYSSLGVSSDVAGSLVRAVEHANDQLFRAAAARGCRMGSTVVACVLKNGVATIAHVGDSRAYQLEHGALRRLTRDHLPATELGALDDDQAKRGPEGHRIARSLGKEPSVDVTVSQQPYESGGRFLLCSDGFSEVLPQSAIQRSLREPTPKRAVRWLWSSAAKSVTDNATAVAIYASGRRVKTRRLLRRALVGAAALAFAGPVAFGGVELWGYLFAPKPATGVVDDARELAIVNRTGKPVFAWLKGQKTAIQIEKGESRSIFVVNTGERSPENAADGVQWSFVDKGSVAEEARLDTKERAWVVESESGPAPGPASGPSPASGADKKKNSGASARQANANPISKTTASPAPSATPSPTPSATPGTESQPASGAEKPGHGGTQPLGKGNTIGTPKAKATVSPPAAPASHK